MTAPTLHVPGMTTSHRIDDPENPAPKDGVFDMACKCGTLMSLHYIGNVCPSKPSAEVMAQRRSQQPLPPPPGEKT